jgi:hypothetical protein
MFATMSTFLGAVVLTVAFGVGAIGCGAACDRSNLCAVTGNGDNVEVCDGNGFRACDDNDRGLTVACVTRPQQAVCTPNGWAFQPTAATQSTDAGK